MGKTTSTTYWANLPAFLAHLQHSTNIVWPLSNLHGPDLYLHQLVETPPNMIPISPHQLRNLPNILKIRKKNIFTLPLRFTAPSVHPMAM
jgi:hypothetical protein